MIERLAATENKRGLLALISSIPRGRVATHDDLARHMKISQPLLQTLLTSFSEDEREITPWHRLVAKGGAIGRGAHRDAQFARLVREGVPVSPAGVVQDLAQLRVAAAALAKAPSGVRADDAPEATAPSRGPAGRSRGMKDRPRDGSR